MIVVQFNDLDEFLTELEREADLTGIVNSDDPKVLLRHRRNGVGDVNRGILRYTARMHAPSSPEARFIQRVSIIAGFIGGDDRLVQIEAPCGSYWHEPLDEAAHERVTERAHALEESLKQAAERLGLDVRNGAFRIVE